MNLGGLEFAIFMIDVIALPIGKGEMGEVFRFRMTFFRFIKR
jgi:hypothetical protein